MNAPIATLALPLALAIAATAADSTAVAHGPEYDPVRHAKMQAALAAGDTATVNSIRAEHRARMQARHGGQGNGGMHGRHGQEPRGNGQCGGRRSTQTSTNP
jgi:hypothetical protein